MWLIGAIIGLLVGGGFDLALALPGALLGGLTGALITALRKQHGAVTTDPAAHSALNHRIERLEAELALLRHDVDVLRAGRVDATGRADFSLATTNTLAAAVTDPPPPEPVAAVLPAPTARDGDGDGNERVFDNLIDNAAGNSTGNSPVVPATTLDTSLPANTNASATAPVIELTMPALPLWLTRIWAGNPLAKIGVVLLFLGVASGLRLAIEHGLLPLTARAALAGIAGLGLILFGHRQASRPDQRNFGIALQGGGVALLYLTVWFMLTRYAMLDALPAFVAFALLGATCIGLALRQDAPLLAIFGCAGAFLAPLLARGPLQTPAVLFAYLTLLNAGVLGIAWVRAWRALNITGFVFTLGVGMAWGIERYGDSDYLLTQLFLVLFLIAYSAMPVATLLRRAAGQGGWEEGILLFGTPLAAAFLQYGLIGDVRATLAVSAVLAAVWYGALWIVLRRAAPARNAPPSWPLVQGTQLAISITFLTLAIPLACGAQVTAALWAIEGAAVLWQGQRQARRLPVIFGLLMQCAAAVTLSLHWHALDRTLPFANDAMLSTLLLVAAALLTARVMRPAAPPGKPQSATASVNLATTHAERHDQAAIAVLAMLWALGWWFGAGGAEILRVIGERDQPAALLVFASGTIIALELLAWRWHWPLLRYTSVLLVVALWLCGAGAVAVAHHPLAGWMGLAVPLAFITHYALLWRHETTGAVPATALRHVGGGWSLLLIASAELAWQAGTLTRGATLWSWIAWTLIMTAGIAAPLAGQRWSRWPFTSPGAGYLPWGVLLPALSLTLGLAWGNVDLDGQGSGLPYLPVASAFDLTQLAGLGALVWLARSASGRLARATRGATLVLTFLWISAMAARITHQWDGTPFTFHAMAESTLFQALLTLIWTITAIGNMILASRRLVRRQWFAGFSLLCVVGAKLLLVDASDSGTLAWTATLLGVAALVLAASYFAPLPPRAPAAADER